MGGEVGFNFSLSEEIFPGVYKPVSSDQIEMQSNVQVQKTSLSHQSLKNQTPRPAAESVESQGNLEIQPESSIERLIDLTRSWKPGRIDKLCGFLSACKGFISLSPFRNASKAYGYRLASRCLQSAGEKGRTFIIENLQKVGAKITISQILRDKGHINDSRVL